jgi:Predicted membrane protein (DUF2207)
MIRRFLGAFFFLLAVVLQCHAEESIDRFISRVNVNTDASLDVVEDISVIAEGRQIRRGILRDFPTEYKKPDGSRYRVGFKVTEVLRNGQSVNWAEESIGNGVRVRIGDAAKLLQPGVHTFTIKYHVTRVIGFFDTYDELYWNVTGSEWTFPIREAYFYITLPQGAVISKHALFTGQFGDTGTNAQIEKVEGNDFSAGTTQGLQSGEGFTVAVAWQKGVVQPPSQSANLRNWIGDNAAYGILAATLLAALAYFFTAWSKVGRDPPGGPIVPLFKPPEGLGPAGTRYVWKQAADNQAFAAALVNLAVKGRVKINNNGDAYSVTRVADSGPALTVSETALFNALPTSTLVLENENYRRVNTARNLLFGALADEFKDTMFVKNFGWFAIGALFSVVGLVLSGLSVPGQDGQVLLFAGVFAAIWWGVLLSVAYGAIQGLFSSRGFFGVMGSVFRLLFLVPFALGGIGVPLLTIFQSGASQSMVMYVLAAAVLGIVNVVFLKLMPAPTPAGRRVLDQIEGFRMYLATAEEKRLDALNPPEKTPELFERYLPYAMALDCENEWNNKFTAVLAAAAAAGATAPVWYGGSSSGWSSGGFARDLSSGLASSVSAAASPPGSVSGTGGGSSGGGGFSGGGGGGGGGSGW